MIEIGSKINDVSCLISTSPLANNKIKIGVSVENNKAWYQDINIYPYNEFTLELYRVLISQAIIKSIVNNILKEEYDDKNKNDYGEPKKYKIYTKVVEAPTAANGSKSITESFIYDADEEIPNWVDSYFVNVIGAPNKLMEDYFIKKFKISIECDGVSSLTTNLRGNGDLTESALALVLAVAVNCTKADVSIVEYEDPEVVPEPPVEAEVIEPDNNPIIRPNDNDATIMDAEFKEIDPTEEDKVVDVFDNLDSSDSVEVADSEE